MIPRRFRPAIILCAGDEGRAIGAQLSVLLASEMDAARRACVVLISVDSARDGTLTGRWLDADDSHTLAVLGHMPPSSSAYGAHPLPQAIVEALRGEEPTARIHTLALPHTGVLDDFAIARVKDEGYAVPRASVVVWIAAAAHTHTLAPIAQAVAEALRVERVEGWTLLALANRFPRDPAAHGERERMCADQPWDDLLLGGSDHKPLANFAYLFETHDERDTFWEGADDVPFAAAEAIFVLTATGITTTREYDESLRRSLPAMVKSPIERIGGIGTSRLTFPRAQAEQYCAGALGAAILREWAREEHTAAPADESDERRRAAQDMVAKLRVATRDDPAYMRGGRPSPRLSAEGVAQARGLKRPDPDGGFMFAYLRRDAVEDLVTRRRDIPDVLRLQAERAAAGFAQWQKAIRAPWQRRSFEAERAVIAEINRLLLRSPAGVSSARVYAEHVHHLLALEKERLYRQQEQREAAYARFQRAMDAACDGPWLDDMPPAADAQSDAKPAPASDILNAPTIISNAPAPGPTDPGDDDHDAPTAPRATRTRDQILDTLAYRYRWRKRRRPPVAAAVGAAAMTVPPAVFLAQGFLPAAWFAAGPLALLLVTLGVALVVGAAGWGYLAWRVSALDEAIEDLRAVYRRERSHACERYEFQQRLAMLTGLQYAARRMLERLTAWESFSEEMASDMEREAQRIERELFDGATGRRDVLVANRQRLLPHGYTLKHFAEDARLRRETAATSGLPGTESWHTSPAALLPHLREHLRDHLRQGAVILDAEPETLTDPVRAFCLAVVRPYLTGDLVSIGAALDAHTLAENALDLFDTLRDRAAILYKPVDPPRPPITFVAARDDYQPAIVERELGGGARVWASFSEPSASRAPAERSGRLASGAVLLSIDDVEWLATLRLLPGGAIPSFWQHRTQPSGRLIVPTVPTWTRPTGTDTGSG